MRIDKWNMDELRKMKNKNGSNASSAQLSDDNGAEVLYFGSEEQGDEKVDKLLFGKCQVKITVISVRKGPERLIHVWNGHSRQKRAGFGVFFVFWPKFAMSNKLHFQLFRQKL